ncbi:hypothetical protein AB0323_16625 [Arthrobacter sp. NPDC080031]|uniref:hypothetical protein n=1 Tax=Arthrobacter sp. NPDC080031 TaxID=3155918 RepID=UPI00344F035F
MKQHAKLHDLLPASARGHVEDLIRFEAETYAKAMMRKGKRKVNGGNVAAFVFVALVTGGVVYGFIALALVWPLFFIGAAIAVGFGGLFLVVGGGQLFDYEADPDVAATADRRQEEISSTTADGTDRIS